MTDLETLIAELSAVTAIGAVVDSASTLAIARELVAARKVVEAARLQIEMAKETHKEWDRDNESRVGKMLMAMAGYLKGYRTETDAIHDAMTAYDATRAGGEGGA